MRENLKTKMQQTAEGLNMEIKKKKNAFNAAKTYESCPNCKQQSKNLTCSTPTLKILSFCR